MSGNNPLSIRYNTLSAFDITSKELHKQHELAEVILDELDTRTLTTIRNAFMETFFISTAGEIFISLDKLMHLLRTSNSGAEKSMVRYGLGRQVSPSATHNINGVTCISVFDFKNLLDAKYHFASLKGYRQSQYLRYVSQLLNYLLEHKTIREHANLFLERVENYRPQLKSDKIDQFNIQHCEFTNTRFADKSKVEFAHINSVITNPHQAIDINNGVIILKEIHRDMTQKHIHTFEGMYEYCLENGYITDWADSIL
jgi:hypothetical protein